MLQPPELCSHPCKGGAPLRRLRMKKEQDASPRQGRCTPKELCREEPILTPCWICFFDHCWSLLWSGKPCLCMRMLNQSGFCQLTGDSLTLTTCQWLQKRKMNRNTLLLCKKNGLLTLLPHLLFSLFYKRTRHPDPNQVGYFDTSVCHLLSTRFPK